MAQNCAWVVSAHCDSWVTKKYAWILSGSSAKTHSKLQYHQYVQYKLGGTQNTLSPVHKMFQATTASTYSPAVMRKTGVKEPVNSTMSPTDKTPAMPDRQPKVLHSPNICPACFGAMSDMLATKPAWPNDVIPRAAVIAATAAMGDILGLARNRRAAAGTSMEMDCRSLRTKVVLWPAALRLSARKPAAELPTAMTNQGTRERKLEERRSKPRA